MRRSWKPTSGGTRSGRVESGRRQPGPPDRYARSVEITDPTLVFLLITLGLVGIGVEAVTPGGFLPGIVGVIAFVIGVIGLVEIGSVSGGIGLLLLAIGLFIAAVALKRYRPLSIAGVVALILSGIFMFDRSTDPTSVPAVIVGAGVLGGFMMFVIERGSKAKDRPVRTGWEELVGMSGDVRSSVNPRGQVFVDGGLWQAELAEGAEPVLLGSRAEVVEVRGLTLIVKNATEGVAE
jgi:membrane-bound serine protease (ClpP class)